MELCVTSVILVNMSVPRVWRGVYGALALLESTWGRLCRIPLISARTSINRRGRRVSLSLITVLWEWIHGPAMGGEGVSGRKVQGGRFFDACIDVRRAFNIIYHRREGDLGVGTHLGLRFQ